MMKFPKKKWSQKNDPNAVKSEKYLQKFTNDYLLINNIQFIRIPDPFWKFLHHTNNKNAIIAFRKQFAGIPDNLCLIPISNKYSLALNLELKSKSGKLHGKQKHHKNLQIAQSPEAVTNIINNFIKDAQYIKQLITQNTNPDNT